MNLWVRIRPALFIAALLCIWHFAVVTQQNRILPTPFETATGIVELLQRGLLIKYVVASLFRVTWGFVGAALLAVPLGLAVGWFGDVAAIYLIFLASFLPLMMTGINAVGSIPQVFINAGRNFGLSGPRLVLRVLYPAVVPQLIIGLRITLGIAWLVVVAAEMIAVNSGLGFLIVDARNAGNRYDLVVAGMVMIGLIGLMLDTGMRTLEKSRALRWGYSED